MATIRAYTTIEQSRKLAEILPLESADMCYVEEDELQGYNMETVHIATLHTPYHDKKCIPCWSLASLLDVLPDDCCGIDKEDGKYVASYVVSNEGGTYISDNPVDACVAMIERLHKLNLL